MFIAASTDGVGDEITLHNYFFAAEVNDIYCENVLKDVKRGI